MKCVVYLSLSLGLITTVYASDGGWTPIVGTGPGFKSIQQPILVDTVLKAASSSQSSITFNGRTITTSIGDNEAASPVLTVDAPDLTSDLDDEPRYLGYEGKILNGFYDTAITVSYSFDEYLKKNEHDIKLILNCCLCDCERR